MIWVIFFLNWPVIMFHVSTIFVNRLNKYLFLVSFVNRDSQHFFCITCYCRFWYLFISYFMMYSFHLFYENCSSKLIQTYCFHLMWFLKSHVVADINVCTLKEYHILSRSFNTICITVCTKYVMTDVKTSCMAKKSKKVRDGQQ